MSTDTHQHRDDTDTDHPAVTLTAEDRNHLYSVSWLLGLMHGNRAGMLAGDRAFTDRGHKRRLSAKSTKPGDVKQVKRCYLDSLNHLKEDIKATGGNPAVLASQWRQGFEAGFRDVIQRIWVEN